MTPPLPTPAFYPLGVDGILIRFAKVLSQEANTRALAFRAAVIAAAPAGLTEVASSLASVRVGFDPVQTDRSTMTATLQVLLTRLTDAGLPPRRRWTIPAAFGPDSAPQLAEAASLAGLTQAQAIAQITSQSLRVIAIGFAPGQPYLGILPDHWDIPRQTQLTQKMPDGALVAAVRQLIIFCADAPTGWRHIGQTAFRVYRPEATQPISFEPGDLVQFTQIPDSELPALRRNQDSNGGSICEALD